jgi:hypothetical protein
MRKRAFFLTSLPLAIIALVAQVIAFYFILLAVANGTFAIWQRIYPHTIFVPDVPTAPVDSFYWIVSIFLWGGLALAIFSLASVVMSFRRGERGWRFVTITLLVVYLGTWLPLLLRDYL